jgi:hypothetical protein
MATRIIEYNSKDVRMPVIDTMSVTEQTPLTTKTMCGPKSKPVSL